ncbi:MAG: hypothetical protein JW889_02260 [Verrucomicrobia bacterium]|nr:hypothetical protein [Verrucomicrobiota bacterium]
MVVMLFGLICLIGGIVLVLPQVWGHLTWAVIRGSIPVILILIGLAAAAVGISSIRDKAAAGAADEPKPTPPEKK